MLQLLETETWSRKKLRRLAVDQLRLECTERGLCSSGTVRELRSRLADHLRSGQVEDTKEQHPVQASVSAGMLGDDHTVAPPLEDSSLGLVDDRTFITRVLPLVPTGLLQLLGACLRSGDNWAECKARLLEEHFPHFVRERLIRDLIVFNFHAREQPLRVYIDQVFQAANFLQYAATEQKIVERLVMNFHPAVLSQAAFLDKSLTAWELYLVVGLIEEWFSVCQERVRTGQGADRGSEGGGTPQPLPGMPHLGQEVRIRDKLNAGIVASRAM